MLEQIPYNRDKAINYAEKWAFGRNPEFLDFENIGGDCTNFASQCIFAGCNVMNFTPMYGWYYKNSFNRTPSWSGTKFLYEFLTLNKSVGPFAIDVDKEQIQPGDIVQLGNEKNEFYHSLIILDIKGDDIFIAAHSEDAYMRELNSYKFDKVRYIHILGANKKIDGRR